MKSFGMNFVRKIRREDGEELDYFRDYAKIMIGLVVLLIDQLVF